MRPRTPKRSRTRALLPQSAARLVGLTALASLGALQWQRLVGGLSSGRALLWVLVAVAAAAAVIGCERIRSHRLQVIALPAVTLLALFFGYWLSGAGLDFLKPKHWDELLSGLGGGLQALGTVRLPVRERRPVAADRARVARRRAVDPRRAADVLAPGERAERAARAAHAARPRVSVRGARGAVRRRRLAGGLAGRDDSVAAARARPGGADDRLPLARAAAAAARARGRRPDRAGAVRRAADRGGGRSRRAVVRLPRVRREPRARRSGALLVDAGLRADHLAARRQRGHARGLAGSAVLEGAQPRRLHQHRMDDALGAAGHAGRGPLLARHAGGLEEHAGVDERHRRLDQAHADR